MLFFCTYFVYSDQNQSGKTNKDNLKFMSAGHYSCVVGNASLLHLLLVEDYIWQTDSFTHSLSTTNKRDRMYEEQEMK